MTHLRLEVRKPIVLSVGGSLIVPDGGPDERFLKTLKRLIDRRLKAGMRFVLVSGGGKTARQYIDVADRVRGNHIEPEDLDWLGIHATRLNGHLLRTIFREHAHLVVIKDPRRAPRRWRWKLLIAAGWKPGWSTDYVACRIAKRLGVGCLINISNVDYVYDVDP